MYCLGRTSARRVAKDLDRLTDTPRRSLTRSPHCSALMISQCHWPSVLSCERGVPSGPRRLALMACAAFWRRRPPPPIFPHCRRPVMHLVRNLLSGRGLTCSSLGPDSLSGFAAAALAARSSESIFRQRSTIRSRENILEKPYFQHAAATKR